MRRRALGRGGVLVELALLMPLLLLLLLGAIHFGFLFYQYNKLEKSVRDGARYAASRTFLSAADLQQKVANVVVYGCPDPTICPTPLVEGLTTSLVYAVPLYATDPLRPARIRVYVNSWQYQGVLSSLMFGGPTVLPSKPDQTVPFIGRVALPSQ